MEDGESSSLPWGRRSFTACSNHDWREEQIASRDEFIDTNAPAVPQRCHRLRWP
jgi:hypothetical protein